MTVQLETSAESYKKMCDALNALQQINAKPKKQRTQALKQRISNCLRIIAEQAAQLKRADVSGSLLQNSDWFEINNDYIPVAQKSLKGREHKPSSDYEAITTDEGWFIPEGISR